MKLIRTSLITVALVAFTTLFANAQAAELVTVEKVNTQEIIKLANDNAKIAFDLTQLTLMSTNEHAQALLAKHLDVLDNNSKQVLSYNQLINKCYKLYLV